MMIKKCKLAYFSMAKFFYPKSALRFMPPTPD